MEATSLVVAVLLLGAHFAAEPLLRRGRAKRLVTSASDARSTLLVTVVGASAIAVSLLARPTLEWGRLVLRPAVLALLALGMLAGVALRYWSMLSLGEYFTRTLTILPDHSIVDTGPYRFVRHPGYLAQLIVLTTGSALLSLNAWLPAAVCFVVFAAYAHRMRAEEIMLSARLGAEYERYRSRTWRLVPGVY
jgi:protein-S-isoprenylcysteine O-methyltransferase Ste14